MARIDILLDGGPVSGNTRTKVEDTLELSKEWHSQQKKRTLVAIIFVLLAFISMIVIVNAVFLSVGLSYGWLAGIGLFTLFFPEFFRGLSVSVTEWTGLVTTNYFTGNMRVYGPGMSARLPWEQVEASRYITLRISERPFEEDFPTKGEVVSAGSPEEIGPMVKVKGLLQFRRVLEDLPRHLGVDESAIEQALVKLVSEAILEAISKMTPTEARSRIKDLKTAALKALDTKLTSDGEIDTSAGNRGKLERMYGINIVIATISDIEIDKSLQEAATNEAVIDRYRRAAERLVTASKKDGTDTATISFEDAMKTVLISAKRASLSVIGVQGQGADAAIAVLKQIFGKA